MIRHLLGAVVGNVTDRDPNLRPLAQIDVVETSRARFRISLAGFRRAVNAAEGFEAPIDKGLRAQRQSVDTRFEVLKRDAEIEALKRRLAENDIDTNLEKDFEYASRSVPESFGAGPVLSEDRRADQGGRNVARCHRC